MTGLDGLLTGSGATWVDGDRRLGPDEIEATIADRVATFDAVPVVPGETVVWTCLNTVTALAYYRACWRRGLVAAPTHPRLDRGLEAGLIEGHPVDLPADAAAILFTAGSSGTPKGVVHTHASLAHKARQMVDVHGLSADDVVLMPAPLSHMSGLLNGLLVPGAAGMTTVLMDRWDPTGALDLIEREHVTFMVGPPTFFLDLWRAPGFAPERVASLRLLSCGGAGVTEAFCNEASERLDCVVKRTYGSTEAPTVATTPAEQHGDPRRASTDGRATPGTELRIVDPESAVDPILLTDQPPGAPGELWVRGPELFWGYLDPAQTADVVTDGGWFRTGDLATVDGEGWLTIVGRLKDVIIRGGENIAPGEVEHVLEAHPAVTQAVVVAEHDDRLGERVAAFVVLSSEPDDALDVEHFDLDECRRWFEAVGAPRFTAPERLVVVDDLPRLPSGKPDRAALRAAL